MLIATDAIEETPDDVGKDKAVQESAVNGALNMLELRSSPCWWSETLAAQSQGYAAPIVIF